jgi:hypothetical protein
VALSELVAAECARFMAVASRADRFALLILCTTRGSAAAESGMPLFVGGTETQLSADESGHNSPSLLGASPRSAKTEMTR